MILGVGLMKVSENQDLVSRIGKAFIEGVQGTGDEFLDSNHIMATAKHFIGDGGTFKGLTRVIPGFRGWFKEYSWNAILFSF